MRLDLLLAMDQQKMDFLLSSGEIGRNDPGESGFKFGKKGERDGSA
jgi:hypothetical protein